MSILVIQGAEEKRNHIHYEVDTSLPPIGAGGMGQVFRGVRVDETTNVRREAAVKFLFDDLPESAIERSRREASVKISSENLVEMFGFIEVETQDATGTIHKRYHVASELLRGVMLHDLLHGKTTDANGEEMPFAVELYRQYNNDRVRFAIFIIRNLLSGVMALHDAGYIHRDIDPSNVMITADGKVKLIDFGICKRLEDGEKSDRHLTAAGQFMGKAAYAAPELVTGDVEHQDATTDLYAVGIMLYELLAGSVPFEGATHEVLSQQLKEAVPVRKLDPKYVRPIVKKATSKKQENRYGSAAEFRVAVEQLAKSTSSDHKTSEGKITVEKEMSLHKRPIIIGIATVAVLVVAGIVIWLLVSAKDSREDAQLAENGVVNVEERKKELAEMIIDDEAVKTVTDSITGFEIPTSGYLISQAKNRLTKAETVEEGMQMLKRVGAKKMKSSAQALALLGALYGHSRTLDVAILEVTDTIIPQDYNKAHQYNEQAIELDGTNYKALYEVGLDYLSGDVRGVVERDLVKSGEYLVKSRDAAAKAGDQEFLTLIEAPLQVLESEGVLKK